MKLYPLYAASMLTAVSLTIASCSSEPEGLVVPGTEVEQLGTGYVFTEGPVADADGNVYFTDIPEQRIHFWSASDGSVTIFREESGGANGLYFDASGRIIAAEGEARQITSLGLDGTVEVIANNIEGLRFNRPNDLWIAPDGGIYFTDPAYGVPEDSLELDSEDVYYISPERSGAVRMLNDYERPNGIIGTADGTTLYVADHFGDMTWVYDIAAGGGLENKRLFVAKGSDGVTLDERGNLYLTDPGANAIHAYSPEGVLLETFEFPEGPANVTFAGPERDMLFVTAVTSVYGLQMSVRGMY